MATVLLPIPARDFDPTEVAVSWQVLTELGHQVTFSTPTGAPGQADDIMLTGRGLDPWGIIPLLRNVTAIGRLLGANKDARLAYAALVNDPAFTDPVPWADVRPEDHDGLLLPGGHRARGIRQYLESPVVQALVVQSFADHKPVAAVCHGVVVAARSIDPATGLSVLHGRRTTALTWQLEKTAWAVGRQTRFWDPHYYRTYREGPGQPSGHMSVQQEVTRTLARPEDFLDVDPLVPDHSVKTSGRARDTMTDPRPAWVVRDGSYVSARWPGDVHTFARTFAEVLDEATTPSS
jgi:putative intracellular protease/amidase